MVNLSAIAGVIMLMNVVGADTREREKIITVTSGSKPKFVTTGNGNLNELTYSTFKSSLNPNLGYTVSDELKSQLALFKRIKNALIVDFSNEDPKEFLISDANYFKVASKRGFVFTTLAILLAVLLFGVFYIRLFHGNCGGYNTIIKKPTKSERYRVFTRISLGLLLFVVGFGFTSFFSFRDRKHSLKAAQDLSARNTQQTNALQKINSEIVKINQIKFNVIYSVLSYENFQVGSFVEEIGVQYTNSQKKALEVNQILLVGTKNNLLIKLLMIVGVTVVLLISWLYSYKHRYLTNAMLLSFLLGLVGVYMMHCLGSSFNYFSIFTELCEQSASAFDPEKADLRIRFNNCFQSFLTCLDQRETELLTAQINSFLIAENTLLIILRNFIRSNPKENIDSFDGLKNYDDLNKHENKLIRLIKDRSASNEPFDYLFRINLEHVIDSALKIPEIYKEAEDLHNCKQLKEWNNSLNRGVCSEGLLGQFYALITFLLAFLGLCLIINGMYSSENVIRGLYNEEIKYVKTNKLRYDWN